MVIRSSVVNGSVANAEDSQGLGFTIEDSEVRVGDRPGTGIGAVDFTAQRVEVTGGNRSLYCLRGCTIRDSWLHGQFTDESGVAHESGIRMGSDTTIVHNSIGCDAPMVPPDAGCSAGLTGYGDLGVIQRNLIQDNLFLTTSGGDVCVRRLHGRQEPRQPASASSTTSSSGVPTTPAASMRRSWTSTPRRRATSGAGTAGTTAPVPGSVSRVPSTGRTATGG